LNNHRTLGHQVATRLAWLSIRNSGMPKHVTLRFHSNSTTLFLRCVFNWHLDAKWRETLLPGFLVKRPEPFSPFIGSRGWLF
jgi:hypothetical protein